VAIKYTCFWQALLPWFVAIKYACFWQTKGHVTRCNFSCNLQCNSTLERCKIAKYESSLHSADVVSVNSNKTGTITRPPSLKPN
jgi:hypothetical protein